MGKKKKDRKHVVIMGQVEDIDCYGSWEELNEQLVDGWDMDEVNGDWSSIADLPMDAAGNVAVILEKVGDDTYKFVSVECNKVTKFIKEEDC